MVNWDVGPENGETNQGGEGCDWLRPVLLFLLAVELAAVVGAVWEAVWRGL